MAFLLLVLSHTPQRVELIKRHAKTSMFGSVCLPCLDPRNVLGMQAGHVIVARLGKCRLSWHSLRFPKQD